MSYRVLIWVMAAAALAANLTVVDLAKKREDGAVFIASDSPIADDQVRQKMVMDGWTNVLVSREGRYFQVMGWKGQLTAHEAVDSQTGRLKGNDAD